MDVNHSECHSTYGKLNFKNTYSLILDAFLLAWQSKSLNSMLCVFRVQEWMYSLPDLLVSVLSSIS